MKFFLPFILVGTGGFVGSTLRYLMSIMFGNFLLIPCGTLISNLAGCFLIGIVTGLSVDIPLFSNESRLFLATGVCGGFTTLSSLIYELAQYYKEEKYLLASFYLTGTFLGAALAFFAGLMLIKTLNRT